MLARSRGRAKPIRHTTASSPPSGGKSATGPPDWRPVRDNGVAVRPRRLSSRRGPKLRRGRAVLLCVPGSLRAGAVNRKLLAEAARLYGGPSQVADLRLPLYDGDLEDAEGIPEGVQTLAAQIAAAEAVAISTPEYNQALSGVLKNALDWVSRAPGAPWRGKPVAIMSAAAGRSGGARATYSLRLAMTPFRPRLSTGPEVLLAAASRQFDEDGRLTDARALKTLTEAMEILRAEADA
ncbi:NADPH-dependent oxidoreductase [Rhodobacteraceae bacterium CCMM004]|nr:NADPH-dependent oxidoreductase [Rhodobacteraceae bacterium CCMM004]